MSNLQPISSVKSQHLQRKRRALLSGLAGRTYIDEQGVLVSNGLSTELICFPSDVQMHRLLLDEKIRNAISYSTAFKDIEEINALLCMPPEDASHHLTLGLYMYLADECSRLNCPKTFLTAMREAGATLAGHENPDRKNLYDRTMQALDILGLKESHGKILSEWYSKGEFTVNGDRNWSEEKTKDDYEMHGAYARLASVIESPQKFLSLNLAISYALGNKQNMQGLCASEAYNATAALTSQEGSKKIDSRIAERIASGMNTRADRIKERIEATFTTSQPLPPAEYKTAFANKMLSLLPDETLELLYRKGYMFAYTNNSNISTCYPKENLPAISLKNNHESRYSSGTRQSRYRMIFLSNGNRMNAQDIANDEALRAKVVSQTVLHESMHLMIGYLSGEQKKRLQNSVETLGYELERHPSDLPPGLLKTIDTNTLAEVADFKSRLYYNYGWNEKWEEVACNLYGLMHAEYPDAQGKNPLQDIPCFAPALAQIEQATKIALEQCRKDYSHVRLEKHAGKDGRQFH